MDSVPARQAVLGVAGVVCAVLLLILPLVSIQPMSGQEAFASIPALFAVSFALGFGVGSGSSGRTPASAASSDRCTQSPCK